MPGVIASAAWGVGGLLGNLPLTGRVRRQARLDDHLLELFPPQKRSLKDFDEHFQARTHPHPLNILTRMGHPAATWLEQLALPRSSWVCISADRFCSCPEEVRYCQKLARPCRFPAA